MEVVITYSMGIIKDEVRQINRKLDEVLAKLKEKEEPKELKDTKFAKEVKK